MLLELIINNLAVIKHAHLEFSSGFNVLTGETGAGKSLISDAVKLVLGGRALEEYIKSGEDKTYIESVFSVEPQKEAFCLLEEWGIELDEDSTLIISREIRRNKNNRSFINGRRVTNTMLKKLRGYLVDIHGQGEGYALVQSQYQLELLDSYGDSEHLRLKKDYKELYSRVNEIEQELNRLKSSKKERLRKIDLLQYEIDEIDSAKLSIEEYKEQKKRRNVLKNLTLLKSSLGEAFELLDGESSSFPVSSQMAEVVKLVNKASEIDSEFKDLSEQCEDISYRIQEIGFELRNKIDSIYAEPGELEEIEDRMDEIQGLMHKYGETIEDILKYRDKIYNQLSEIKKEKDLSSELENRLKKYKSKLLKLGKKLTEKRKKISSSLQSRIIKELTELMLEKTRFEIKLLPLEKPQSEGLEKIEFYISTNPGEDLKPLKEVASGGEISRIMLALNAIYADVGELPSLIFDELDAGIGGQTANAVAQKMSSLAQDHQLLCITHLPQIASYADCHFLVEKKATGQNTTVRANKLNKEERVKELARMLGGLEMPEFTIKHAQAILKNKK